MRRTFSILLAAAVILAACGAALAAEPRHERRIRLAAEGIEKMQGEADAGAFADTVDSCKAIAIFPAVVKAGLGIGGMSGEGIVLVRGKDGKWSGPSFARITGGSFGLQIGISETFLILTVVNDDGLRLFTGGTGFELGGDVSVAAGPVGRNASAATDTRASASIYSYSMSKGAFAGLTISGSSIDVNTDANKAYWGKATDAKTALSHPASGAKIKPLVDALNKLVKLSK